jgi:Ca2+-binding RTX toxin-like protein
MMKVNSFIQLLERRRMLSVSLANGILTVLGDRTTAGAGLNDHILIVLRRHMYTVFQNHNTAQSFRSASVSGVLVDSGAGKDTIVCGGVLVPQTLVGGSSSDTIVGGWGDDAISGGKGSDSLVGAAGDDSIGGGDDSDILLGGSGDDLLTGGADGDSLNGGSEIPSGTSDGDDTLDGGNGLDTASYTGRTDDLVLDANNGDISGGTGEADHILEVEHLFGGGGDDLLLGSDAGNVLVGTTGDDTMFGGKGIDFLIGGEGRDFYVGGDDDDFMDARDGAADYIIGIAGQDLSQVDVVPGPDGSTVPLEHFESRYSPAGGAPIDPQPPAAATQAAKFAAASPTAAPAAPAAPATPIDLAADGSLTVRGTLGPGGAPVADSIQLTQDGGVLAVSVNSVRQTFDVGQITRITVDAGGGNDKISLQNADGSQGVTIPSVITGGNGNDSIVGGIAADLISGAGGNDLINGGLGNDSLLGGAGDDTLLGGRGLDTLNGGLGSFSSGSDGSDLLDGGRDEDTAQYTFRLDDLHISLDGVVNDGAAGEGDQILNIEDVFSGNGNDVITGSADRNFFSGSGGQDTIDAMAGNDVIFGSRQTDTLAGGDGTDIIFAVDGKRDQITPGTEGNKFTRGDRVDVFVT